MDVERISSQITGAGTVGGGLVAAFSGLSMSEYGVWAGILLTAFFGFLNVLPPVFICEGCVSDFFSFKIRFFRYNKWDKI